ncbi:aldehyde ferredoxin oxidoreductase family protein [Candidatus Harpocratesius sp.]
MKEESKMVEKFGYFGKILWINLSTHEIIEREIPEEWYHQYLGGYGLAVRILFEEIPVDADPLGPDNILAFMPGLLTGTTTPFTGRYMVCGKSPLSGGWGDSNSGGTFGPEIKKCGYDGIIFVGKSEEPVYLLVKEGKAVIKDASSLWGKDAIETDDFLKNKYGNRIRVAAIGMAGENLIRNAGIVNDKGRIAARSGLGAVMGSKKLKAVALIGHTKYPYKNMKSVIQMTKEYKDKMKFKDLMSRVMMKFNNILPGMMRMIKMDLFLTEGMQVTMMSKYGTGLSTAISSEVGDAPVKNWNGVGYIDFPQKKVRNLTAQNLEQWKVKPYGCFSCPLRCGAILSVPELDLKETHRPEYETATAFGALILNDDVNTLLKVNEYLNRAGYDSISAGGVVAFAIECFENGIITKEDTGGLEIGWGNSESIMPLLEMIVKREHIGKILADGVKIAAEKIGKGAEKFAVHANGQELPMHDSKFGPSLATTYVSDPTPGRHTAASIDFMEVGPIGKFIKGLKIPKSKKHKYDSKGPAQAFMAKIHQTVNALGFCNFATWSGNIRLLDFIFQATGIQLTNNDLIKIGYRIQTLRQAFNAKHGAIQHQINTRALGIPPMEKGPLKGIKLDIKTMVRDYYESMSWDPETGVPTISALEQLELDFAKNSLKLNTKNTTIVMLP